MFLLPLALAAAPANPTFFTTIDSPADGAVIDPETTPVLDLMGHVASGVTPASMLICSWYMDGLLIDSKPFAQDGTCDASITTASMADGGHIAVLEGRDLSGLRTSTTTIAVLVRQGPALVATRDVDCTAASGHFVLTGTAYGADVWDHDLTLSISNGDDIPDTMTDATSSGAESLVQRVQTLCTTTTPGSRCEAPFTFDFTVDDSTAGPWNWRIDMVEVGPRGGVTPPTPRTATYPTTTTPTVPLGRLAYQPLMIIEPPSLVFAEILDGVVQDSSTSATWSNEAAYSPYQLLVTYTPNRAEEIVWQGASFAAVDERGGSTELSCTRNAGTMGTAATAEYTCDLVTDGIFVTPYTIAMTSGDGECQAPQTFALTIDDPTRVDHDRDGVTDQDGDCDDDDPEVYTDAPDAQCDGIDQNCVEGADDGAADVDEDPNEIDLIEGATLTGDTVSASGGKMSASGNLHAEDDVDWFEFSLGAGEDSGVRNASMIVKLSVPGDDYAPYGSWSLDVEAGLDSSSPNPDMNPSMTSWGEPVYSSGSWTYTWTVEGDDDDDFEWAWWLAVRSDAFDEAMCAPTGETTYLLRAFE